MSKVRSLMLFSNRHIKIVKFFERIHLIKVESFTDYLHPITEEFVCKLIGVGGFYPVVRLLGIFFSSGLFVDELAKKRIRMVDEVLKNSQELQR